MNRLTARLIPPMAASILALLATLAGCDQERAKRVEAGVSTEADVRRVYGEPTRIVEHADGGKTLEYPRQPEGSTNLRIQIGADGRMLGIQQQLSGPMRERVQPGMSQDEVRRLLGQPARAQRFELKPDEEHWEYRINPSGNERQVFTVTFDRDGRVLRTATQADMRDTHTGG